MLLTFLLVKIAAIKESVAVINSLFNIDVVTPETGLNEEQRTIFFEVILKSLRVTEHGHLFNWLQGSFQSLLGHDVMVYGIKTSEKESYQYQYLTCSRYFDDFKFNQVIQYDTGIVPQFLNLWQKRSHPLMVTHDLVELEANNYTVANFDKSAMKNSELVNVIAHGFGDQSSKISTFVMFGRLSKPLNPNHAYMLELIMPHLHCALVRIASVSENTVWVPNSNRLDKKITGRESEILHWVQLGKTNWEISTILSISPLTVKNHVQNILRKLDAPNRSQAALKAAKLGLVRILK